VGFRYSVLNFAGFPMVPVSGPEAARIFGATVFAAEIATGFSYIG